VRGDGAGGTAGSSGGSSHRAHAPATTMPVTENTPSCASPWNPEKNIAAKPAAEVATASATPRHSCGCARPSGRRWTHA
jgi:hypothetical protein